MYGFQAGSVFCDPKARYKSRRRVKEGAQRQELENKVDGHSVPMRYRTRVNTFRFEYSRYSVSGNDNMRDGHKRPSHSELLCWTGHGNDSVIGGANDSANLASHCLAKPLLGGYKKAKI